MCCYSIGHRRWKIWCHTSLRRRVKPLQHVGQSPAFYRHLCYGQLLSLHAWQCGAVGRCQRGGIWRSHKSSTRDLWRPALWFLRTRLSIWKHFHCRGNPLPNTALGTYKDGSKETHVYMLSYDGLFRPLFCFMFAETLLSALPITKMNVINKKKEKKISLHFQGQNRVSVALAEAKHSCWYYICFSLCCVLQKRLLSTNSWVF